MVTLIERLELADRIELEPADDLTVHGFADDTLVHAALVALAATAGVDPTWRVRIDKRIPVAAGLGGGSSDAATALALANATLLRPLPSEALHEVASTLGADVPFFLTTGSQLATGDGTTLEPIALGLAYTVLLIVPSGIRKPSTASVYERFDAVGGSRGFDARRRAVLDALPRLETVDDLAELPPNDLASSPIADDLRRLGAFRADVTGAGPVVYGLFADHDRAHRAATHFSESGETIVTRPC